MYHDRLGGPCLFHHRSRFSKCHFHLTSIPEGPRHRNAGLLTGHQIKPFLWSLSGSFQNVGVSKNRGTSISHPKMIIFSRKTHVPPFMETSTWLFFVWGWWSGEVFFGAEVVTTPLFRKWVLETAHDELTGFTAVSCCMSIGGFKKPGCQSKSFWW